MRLGSKVRSDAPAPVAPIARSSAELSAHEVCLPSTPLSRPPSQKELATVFGITTRHLRRWEQSENEAGRPCSRPYSAADLWRLYQRRYPKKWDPAAAARLRLAPLFEQFDGIMGRNAATAECNEQTTLTGLMLRSLACDEDAVPLGMPPLPQPLRASLARAAKQQLRGILDCDRARTAFLRAFFEAALLADAGRTHLAGAPSFALSA